MIFKNSIIGLLLLVVLSSWQSNNVIVDSRESFERLDAVREKLQDEFNGSAVYTLPEFYLKSFESAQQWAKKNGTNKEVNLADYNLLFYHYNHQNSDKVIEIANRLLTHPEFMETIESVRTLVALNYSYSRKGFYKRQLEVLPLMIAQNKKFDYLVFDKDFKDSHELAMIYYRLKQYDKSRENFHIQANSYRKNDQLFMYASMLNNIGLTYEGDADFENAISYYEDAIDVLDNDLDEDDLYYNQDYKNHFENVVQSNIASIQMRQGDLDQAEQVFLRELQSSKDVGELRISIQSYLHLSELNLLQGNLVSAIRYTDSALALEKSFKNPSVRADILSVRSKVFLLQDKIRESHDAEILSNDITDSISRVNSQKNLEEASLKYDFVKIREEVNEAKNLLKEKNKIQWLQWVIVAISIILVITFIILFIHGRRARKLSETQSLQLKKAADEKELMLYEIHHRIKNNLQTVSGILELKTSQLSNPKFTAAINESQQLIQTMNMVHDQLYEHGKDTVVDMQSHFTKICAAIISQYGKNMALQVSARNITINTEDAIPLGLILCELVTNSMKHGFKQSGNGRIAVSLEKEASNFTFKYTDDGSGFSSNSETETKSVGMSLIGLLVEELDGTMTTDTAQGFTFIMQF